MVLTQKAPRDFYFDVEHRVGYSRNGREQSFSYKLAALIPLTTSLISGSLRVLLEHYPPPLLECLRQLGIPFQELSEQRVSSDYLSWPPF